MTGGWNTLPKICAVTLPYCKARPKHTATEDQPKNSPPPITTKHGNAFQVKSGSNQPPMLMSINERHRQIISEKLKSRSEKEQNSRGANETPPPHWEPASQANRQTGEGGRERERAGNSPLPQPASSFPGQEKTPIRLRYS